MHEGPHRSTRGRVVCGRTALLAAVASLAACAAQGPSKPEPRNPCDQEAVITGDAPEIVDDTRVMLEETGCKTALWLDGLFADEADIESARNTNGYLSTSASYSEFEGFDTKVRLRVRLKLPSLKGRTSAFLGREDQSDFISDRVERFSLSSQLPKIDDREEWLAGLGYALPGSKRVSVDFRVGASGLAEPRAFLRSRVHYTVYSDNERVAYLRVTPFWQTRDGVGVTLGANYSQVLSEMLLLRLSSIGTTTEADTGVDWSNAVTLYQNLTKGRGMAYQLFITGDTNAPEPLYEYGGAATFRQPLFGEKLYGEFSLGYTWPRIDPALPREGSYEVGIGLELPFGKDD
ncbi:MAG TPA: hypothetical protein VGE51_07045 [Fontimonas sp.]